MFASLASTLYLLVNAVHTDYRANSYKGTGYLSTLLDISEYLYKIIFFHWLSPGFQPISE